MKANKNVLPFPWWGIYRSSDRLTTEQKNYLNHFPSDKDFNDFIIKNFYKELIVSARITIVDGVNMARKRFPDPHEFVIMPNEPKPLFHITGWVYSDKSTAAKAARIRYGNIADAIRGLNRSTICMEELMVTKASQKHCRTCGSYLCKMKEMIQNRDNWIGWKDTAFKTQKRRDKQTGRAVLLMALLLVLFYAVGVAIDTM